ncbi:two-component sensor histidine kinase [Clostridium thermosuccinogenes]|uniref:histidine kinase n=1 Tax=Clostridium thermosuccinogenes TaxID=84032 RepID=A0A2K2FAA0_9CLOT|nr:HAMP domain-containing sensor histidine kinase [Pseudoclostridium thermosuccinogenes]AUS98032.1 two-component sensor histidine kinase [Pseudoclostridium thermosuccinogenes]PNT91341.1 two-component sensor histidine kinase [Pseudoclostridium thermosuccinogenes]PNT95719.1 two-component sensor histidine kinase [Pseudoclostridium thermosuccinogenes]PNT96976.1 two-component sensor histidine kinase [Pseudoclostridium thermosuccinogenes]
MKNRPLVTQFRLAFTWIVIASITATAITYALAAVLYFKAQYKSIYPANYYERQIPDIDAYIRDKNTALLLQSGEKGLQSIISGDGIYYQVLDGEGNILYGTSNEKIYSDKSELYYRLNTTAKKQNYYIHTVPIIDDSGKVLGAVALLYQLKISYAGGRGWWVIAVLTVAMISPFLYILGFTMLFSRIFVNNINRPLQLLMDASLKIKEKDLDFEIDYFSDNELGKLCVAFSEMKDELKKSLSAQWKMEQERVEMVEALAHDLKAPLSIIRGYSEALIDANIDGEEKLRKYLEVIKGNAEKCSALVQQMQYTMGLERADVKLQLVPVKLSEFLEQKVHQYELQAKQKGIAIILNMQGEINSSVFIDTDRLERILDNIVSNSLQYTPIGGSINISVKAEKENIFYEICDSGSGFSKRDLEKAFDKFYRGDEARRSKGGHSGLGLFIVKQLLEQLDGSIKLSNLESGGACVTFRHKVFRNNGKNSQGMIDPLKK